MRKKYAGEVWKTRDGLEQAPAVSLCCGISSLLSSLHMNTSAFGHLSIVLQDAGFQQKAHIYPLPLWHTKKLNLHRRPLILSKYVSAF